MLGLVYTVNFLLKLKKKKTSESVIAVQRTFRAHFMLRQNDAVPGRIFNP